MEPLLSVKNLKTYFKTDDGVVKAVDGVSFDVHAGETLGIVGESGSGKSVANLSVLQLIPRPPGYFPSGEIWFEGKNLLKLSDKEMRSIRGNRISMIFQDPMTSLNPFLTVGRQLTEVLEIHKGMTGAEAAKKAIGMLERVGISEAAHRFEQYPHQFSGGMRQRVMIAMALLCEPKLLIADEPTTALDVTIQAQILALIDDLQRDFGTSVILITHDLGVVAGMAKRVAVMYAGRIVEEGTVEELFEKPRHPYTLGLLKSIPRLNEERMEKLEPIRGLPPDLSNLPGGCPFSPRCDFVTDRCKSDYPDAVLFGEKRWSACWEAKRL
jgi:oligopeptide transport system ATP-binding protein